MCFLLVFVPYAPLVPCGPGFFCFFSGKECRPTADRSIKMMKKEKRDYVRLGGTLDAELQNA